MINLQFLEDNKDELRLSYLLAKPFPYLAIDNFCDAEKLKSMYAGIPDLKNKSRDYVFAHNKFEKSNYKELGPLFLELYQDLCSGRMNAFLSYIDMHLDFNYHPLHTNWYRNMNLLLYLNKDWQPEYRGHLKLVDLRSGEEKELDVPFNRMIIQQTRPYTLHGYGMTNFPDNKFRTSIAKTVSGRSSRWRMLSAN